MGNKFNTLDREPMGGVDPGQIKITVGDGAPGWGDGVGCLGGLVAGKKITANLGGRFGFEIWP
jgi:hypothetical protein